VKRPFGKKNFRSNELYRGLWHTRCKRGPNKHIYYYYWPVPVKMILRSNDVRSNGVRSKGVSVKRLNRKVIWPKAFSVKDLLSERFFLNIWPKSHFIECLFQRLRLNSYFIDSPWLKVKILTVNHLSNQIASKLEILAFSVFTCHIWNMREVLVYCREKWKFFFAYFHFLGLFMT
jgi:hypothetical protein